MFGIDEFIGPVDALRRVFRPTFATPTPAQTGAPGVPTGERFGGDPREQAYRGPNRTAPDEGADAPHAGPPVPPPVLVQQPPVPTFQTPPEPPPGPMPGVLSMQPPQEQPVQTGALGQPLPLPPQPVPPPPAGALSANPGDRPGPMDFEQRLVGSESSGNPTATNREGFSGLYQFGSERLTDLGFYTPAQGEGRNGWRGAFNIPGFDGVRTRADFLANPDAQRAAFQAHIADVDKAIDALPAASAFDRNGLRAVAHLGGVTGMRRYIETGGQYNPRDSNGTSLQDYYTRFSGTDAPLGLQARGGAPQGVQTAGADAQALPGAAGRDAPGPDLTALLTGGEAPTESRPALDPTMLSLAAGLLSGRTPMESFGNAATGLLRTQERQTDRDRIKASEAERRAIARAQLGLSARAGERADAAAVRSDRQLQISQQRADATDRRLTGSTNGQFVHSSTEVVDPDTQRVYTKQQLRDGTVNILGTDGQPVPDEVRQRLMRGSDTGIGAGNSTVQREAAKRNAEQSQSLFDNFSTSQESLRNVQNIRELVQKEGIVGPSVLQTMQRFFVRYAGLPIGSVTPQGLSLNDQQISEFSTTRLPALLAAMKPVSNVDLQTFQRALLDARQDPKAMLTLLDLMEPAVQRQARMSREWAELPESVRGSILRNPNGGVDSWIAGRRQAYDADGFYPGRTVSQPPGGGDWTALGEGANRIRIRERPASPQ